MERFQKLTVPELRETAKRRNLNTSGKKQQLLMRLSIWVRDELASVTPIADSNAMEEENENGTTNTGSKNQEHKDEVIDACAILDEDDDSDSDGSDEDDDSSEDEELDIFDAPDRKDNDSECDHTETDTSRIMHPKKSQSNLLAQQSSDEAIQSDEIQSLLSSLFGYTHLRKGQEFAINRCLEKKRTLFVAPTGKLYSHNLRRAF